MMKFNFDLTLILLLLLTSATSVGYCYGCCLAEQCSLRYSDSAKFKVNSVNDIIS